MKARKLPGAIEIVGEKKRRPILASREPFLQAVLKVLNDLDAFRPLSLRQIHYNLLNILPFINAKTGKRYSNTADAYNQLSLLKNDAIAEGRIAEVVTEDITRPVVEWATYSNAVARAPASSSSSDSDPPASRSRSINSLSARRRS